MANRKYYSEPPSGDFDFKSLVQRAIAAGVGRDVPDGGEPIQPWTADALTTAMNQTERGGSVIDLRTVQRWLAPNGRGGISVPNLSRLALVFGCGDPVKARSWQVALMRARERSRVGQRNAAINTAPDDASNQIPTTVKTSRPMTVVRSWEGWFSRDKALILAILVWATYAVNGLANGIFGMLSVSYDVMPGLAKEVGFLWAPTWTVLPVLILPLFIVGVSDTLAHWRAYGRCRLLDKPPIEDCTANDIVAWDDRIDGTAFSFWTILMLSVGGVFLAQWVGICLRLYAEGDAGIYQIDRNLLTLLRPDFIGRGASAVISMFGYIYSALYVFIFLTGLKFLFILSADYEALARTNKEAEHDHGTAIREGSLIAFSAFDAALLIGWAAIAIKLQAAYLSSDAPNMIVWLLRDLTAALRLSDEVNGSLPNTSVSHFTTFLMIAVGNFALFVCATRISKGQIALRRSEPSDSIPTQSWLGFIPWKMFILSQAFIAVSLLSIGQIQGFSLALICCLSFSTWWLLWHRAWLEKEHDHGTSTSIHGDS